MNSVEITPRKISETKLTCYQGFLRNRRVYQATTTCQTLGTLIGITAAVAGFYFASLHESYSNYAYALGAIGVMMMLYSCFALSYSIDYAKVVIEVKKVKTLEEANDELQEQLKILDRMEAGLAREGDELESNLGLLKDQVETFASQMTGLAAEVKTTTEATDALRLISEGIRDNEKGLSLGAAKLAEVVEDANEVYAKAQAQNLEVLSSIEQVEQKAIMRETAFIEALAKADLLARYRLVCEDLGKLKTEDPQKYEELIAQFPSLAV